MLVPEDRWAKVISLGLRGAFAPAASGLATGNCFFSQKTLVGRSVLVRVNDIFERMGKVLIDGGASPFLQHWAPIVTISKLGYGYSSLSMLKF